MELMLFMKYQLHANAWLKEYFTIIFCRNHYFFHPWFQNSLNLELPSTKYLRLLYYLQQSANSNSVVYYEISAVLFKEKENNVQGEHWVQDNINSRL